MRVFEELQSTFLLSQKFAKEEHLKFEQSVVSLEESNNPLFKNMYFKNPLSKFQELSKLSLSVQFNFFFQSLPDIQTVQIEKNSKEKKWLQISTISSRTME
jgi:hypothetical protein